MVSVITAPPSTCPASRPASVTMGMAELRSVCFPITRPSPSPLARAVRTYSSPSASSTAERGRRALREEEKGARKKEGRNEWTDRAAARGRHRQGETHKKSNNKQK